MNGQPRHSNDPGSDNPLLTPYNTPFNVPPFDKIKDEHFMPAFKKAILEQQKEIDAIVNNPEPPNFTNTIVAFNNKGLLLSEVENIFNTFKSANTNENLQKLSEEISPMLAKDDDNIFLNEKLFQRIKQVYDSREKLNLAEDQLRLLENFYKEFTRKGANLNAKDKEKLREINQQLSVLSVKFDTNILKENNTFMLVIDKKEDLDGLPQGLIDSASAVAAQRKLPGKWVFTLHRPSIFPFLQYSKKRELREKIFKAYINRGNNGNEMNNQSLISGIVSLRAEKAKLLGYQTYADYVLENNMALKPINVYNYLNQLWKPALEMSKKEAADLQTLIDKEGGKFKLEPWDWWFYTEKLKKDKFDLDDEITRPYFKLENVREGAFYVANKLYGLKFIERTDVPVYQPDVKVFEVQEKDGTYVGLLYMDFFIKPGKRGGAWANAVRKEWKQDGKRIPPIICNTHNLSQPTGNGPVLLNFDEVETIFHEFGHGLHGLLANCTYRTQSGTSVPRDFVELPSQIMENWATEPEVLKVYAKHYQTGEIIPQELVEKIKKAERFNKGFETVEYLAASFLDMDWHTIPAGTKVDNINAFETAALTKIGLIPQIVTRYRSTYFNHIFSGGYASGYYSYTWAELLDADAFQAFKETSLFDPNVAQSFRVNILEKGGSVDAMVMYKRFRGAEPKIEPLLRRNGFIQ
ncbi:MAG: M3 family metallopeptidase [Candidatus Omnitrophota bacterium]